MVDCKSKIIPLTRVIRGFAIHKYICTQINSIIYKERQVQIIICNHLKRITCSILVKYRLEYVNLPEFQRLYILNMSSLKINICSVYARHVIYETALGKFPEPILPSAVPNPDAGTNSCQDLLASLTHFIIHNHAT